ncbi:MAG: leucyl/phenylalanyl-tRNA--protein transferase [Planctomycetota bacterium]|nr:leucyl/phenylalanyl-tRNA--protein transferase [Planctomycetota bacterium]
MAAVDIPIETEFDRPFTVENVLEGYSQGIFPMGDDEDDLIYWFSPDPRAILPLSEFHISRSLRRSIRRGGFEVTANRAFADVMVGCGEGRPVWITDRVHELYNQLHELDRAHSIEVWLEDRLVGGLYGVQVGGAFMAESKFHRVTNASKVALAALVEHLKLHGFLLLEIQYMTDHLSRFGAREISREDYLRELKRVSEVDCRF